MTRCTRDAVAARMGEMMLVRAEQIEESEPDAQAPVEWEFTLGGVTYVAALRVAQRRQR
jgi:hypothetical protein